MEAEESARISKTKEEIEAGITKSMLSLLSDFKEQADNLTLEGVRRALEKDLGMERLSLDAHKKFVKQCLQKYFYDADDKNASKTEGENAEKSLQPAKEQVSGQSVYLKKSSSDLDEKLDSSPVLEGDELAAHKTGKSDDGSEQDSKISEDLIKKAIKRRASYFRSNLEITLVKVRRLLEEDLEIEQNSLDPYKKFISSELDAVLQSSATVQARNGAKKDRKETPKRRAPQKTGRGAKKARMDSDSDGDSDDVSSENDEDDEEIAKPKKQPAKVKRTPNKRAPQKTGKGTKRARMDSDSDADSEDVSSENEEDDEEIKKPKKPKRQPAGVKGSKKQKLSTEKSKASGAGKKKAVEADSEKSDGSDLEKASDDDGSQSSDEEEVKKKGEKPVQTYGKRVEQLKSTIKSCGMSIPPSVYKKIKQAPESKREAHLIKELEAILEKEGLSANPSEKEIKAVKKMKQRAKELEGIDMSNIVSSSRRRTTSFIPLPKPKVEAESDESGEGEEDEEDEEDEENEEDSDADNNDGEDSSQGSDDDDAEEESD